MIASRLAVHVIKWSKTLPDPDHFKHSVVISVIIHGSSLALLSLLTYGLWLAIAVCGNVAHQFLFKLTQWPISSGIVLPAIQKFPITVGFLLVSMAYGSCGGLAIICAVIMYFIILSKMYEDYLEEFVFKTAAVITEKLFGKKRNPPNTQTSNAGERKSAPAPVPAITQPKIDTTMPTNPTKDDTNDEASKTIDEPTVSQSEDKKEEVIEETEDKEEIEKCETVKKAVKKVEFDVSGDGDEQQKHSQEASTSAEMNVAESKTSLDAKIDGDAIVKSSSQESFEMLYSQLDPEDVAMFTQKDEPEEMTEEQRLELEKAEAGKNKRIIFQTISRGIKKKTNFSKSYRTGETDDTNGGTSKDRRRETECRNENCSCRI